MPRSALASVVALGSASGVVPGAAGGATLPAREAPWARRGSHASAPDACWLSAAALGDAARIVAGDWGIAGGWLYGVRRTEGR